MPRRLARYLFRETTGLYVLGVAAFCLLLSIDFLAVWAQFLIEQDASPGVVARLMLFKLPWFLHLSLPVAVVFAVLLATGRLARDSELKAAYSLGVAPSAMLAPLLLLGLLVSGISLLNNGYVEPEAETAYNRLVDSFFYTRPPAAARSNVSFGLADEGVYFASRIRARSGDTGRAELSGVLLVRPDGTTLTAASGVWDSDNRVWHLESVERTPPGGPPEPVGSLTVPFELPGEAEQALAQRETLGLGELHERIVVLRGAGGAVRSLIFEFHRRVADAFSSLVFVLFAGTLGLGLRGRSAGFAWTIVLLVAFWATWTVAGSLFEKGVLGPAAAAWLTPGVVGAGGLLLAGLRLRP